MPHNVFREGHIHVCEERCSTCIFRAGNLMLLNRGRVKGMVEESKANESAIVCHQTLDGNNAVCRGFFDLHPTQPLQVAERLGFVRFVAVAK